MIRAGIHNRILLAVFTVAISLISISAVADEINPTLTLATQPAGKGASHNDTHPTKNGDSKSFLREWTFENSFDQAADSVQRVEKNLNDKVNYKCEQYTGSFQRDGKTFTPQQTMALAAECRRRQNAANGFGKEAASIKGQQRIFAEVSRVSDIAAVAAIGGLGYAEVMQKKSGQGATYRSAANVEKVAGAASYTTGAADVAMGAWAYINQKKKLETMQDTLSGATSGVTSSSGNGNLDSNLSRAIENTKKAAYSHMLYGMGKVAVGYASMKLAKRTEEQAAMLESIPYPGYAFPVAAAPSTVSPSNNGGGSATFQTNQPTFSMATTAGSTETPLSAGATGSGFGSSSMPTSEMRSALANAKNNSGVSSGSGGSGLSASGVAAGAGSSEGASTDPAAAGDKSEMAKPNLGPSFEISRGGGVPSFSGHSGGSGDDSGASALANAMGGIMGGGDISVTRSVAANINPDQVYEDATAGLEGNEQGSMAGVNSSRDKSLFDIVKVNYNKALQLGNLQGPSAVEIKN
jgi:hypothetical protein